MAVDSDDDSALLTAGAEQGAADEAELRADAGDEAELRHAGRGRQLSSTDADSGHRRLGGRQTPSAVPDEHITRTDGTVHGQQVAEEPHSSALLPHHRLH